MKHEVHTTDERTMTMHTNDRTSTYLVQWFTTELDTDVDVYNASVLAQSASQTLKCLGMEEDTNRAEIVLRAILHAYMNGVEDGYIEGYVVGSDTALEDGH